MSTTGKRVLLAEDSTVTQDLLTLILGQKGHIIDIAEDGEQTLEKLRNNEYDIALIDYHLPKMTGLKAVTTYLRDMHGMMIPKLVAMTGDTTALLSSGDDCEVFKGYLKKPISIGDVVPAIEAEDAVQSVYIAAEGKRNELAAAELILPFSGNNLNLVYYPNSFIDYQLRPDIVQRIAAFGAPDAILVLSTLNEREKNAVARLSFAHVTPIIDLTNKLKNKVDLSKPETEITDIALNELIKRYAEKRATLHEDLLKVENDDEFLLVRMFMAGNDFAPVYDPEDRQCVSYQTLLDTQFVMNTSNILVEKGLIKKIFFDRFFSCRSCASRRLVVHEECPDCRSKNINEEQYIHHYKCAHQAPESKFRIGDRLICPKCRTELVSFGGDYDKPGAQHICTACGSSSTDPAVGFICLDCHDHTDGDAVVATDCHKFEFTDLGLEFLQIGKIALGDFSKSLRFSDLPLEFVVKLNTSAKAFMNESKPFCLISIGYKNQFATERENGVHVIQKARSAFISLIREGVDLNAVTSMSKTTDYLLVQTKDKEECETILSNLLEKAKTSLNINLEPYVTCFGPQELSQ